MSSPIDLGVIGTGALGGAIARAALRAGMVRPEGLKLCNLSGRLDGFEAWAGLSATREPNDLADRELILLALPPAALPCLGLAVDRPVLSVMAGVSVAKLGAATGSRRILRAMSSPAAERGLAFSPLFAAPGASPADRAVAERLLAACGVVEAVPKEAHLDVFTALTGPVPGFVAYFARAMAAFAVAEGIAPETADRAIRQLFLASGVVLAEDAPSAGEHVRAMIEYAGTTAAGLEALERSELTRVLHAALAASVARARTIAG